MGPDRVLGDHDRLEHGGLRAAVQHAVEAAAAGRHRGRAEHAAPLLRAPYHGVPPARGRVPGRSLLAHPKRWWDLGSAMTAFRVVPPMLLAHAPWSALAPVLGGA